MSALYINLFSCCLVCADDEKVQIVNKGHDFAGKIGTIKSDFPYLSSNRPRCRELVNRVVKKHQFPFDLIDSSGNDNMKEREELDNPLCFFILITKESLLSDTYIIDREDYVKYCFDVGLAAIFLTPTKNMDKIEFAIPVIVENVRLRNGSEGNYYKEEEIIDIFFETFKNALDLLLKKVEKVNPRKVKAKVVKVSGNFVHIDAGKKDGIIENEKAKSESGSGKIVKLKKHSAIINCIDGKFHKGDVVEFYICKSDDTETYQVVDVKITSKNAKNIIESKGNSSNFKVLCAQRYSDYLSDRGGVIVLPPKIGAVYNKEVKKAINSAYSSDNDSVEFAIADAKNKVLLNISSISKKIVKENDLKQIWAYKAWIEQDVNGQKKEVSESIRKSIAPDGNIDDYQVVKELILQTLAKLAKDF
ncbi:MAG: hypothetical protein GY797_13200 [Deltaproteobacteria bacterium]|nr:hypothetical protein [Deltaproteobacteria bacterium]